MGYQTHHYIVDTRTDIIFIRYAGQMRNMAVERIGEETDLLEGVATWNAERAKLGSLCLRQVEIARQCDAVSHLDVEIIYRHGQARCRGEHQPGGDIE